MSSPHSTAARQLTRQAFEAGEKRIDPRIDKSLPTLTNRARRAPSASHRYAGLMDFRNVTQGLRGACGMPASRFVAGLASTDTDHSRRMANSSLAGHGRFSQSAMTWLWCFMPASTIVLVELASVYGSPIFSRSILPRHP